jgi:hypothetical protein
MTIPWLDDPLLLRPLLVGLALAVLGAPLGCLVVWRRIAFFGETMAHAPCPASPSPCSPACPPSPEPPPRPWPPP